MSACNAADSWVRKIPWRRKWQSTPALLPGKSHGWRSLIGYTPWGRKESDTTEWLHLTSSLQLSNRLLFSRSGAWDSFGTTWTVACQASLSLGFLRQEYWSELPSPFPGDLPDPGIEPASPALAMGFFTTEPPGKPNLGKERPVISDCLLNLFMS